MLLVCSIIINMKKFIPGYQAYCSIVFFIFCVFADVGGLFVMKYTREGKDMIVTESSNKLKVVVDDTFRLACAAAKFKYASVNLTFSGQG